ncbi:MinD/ParA family ATP-binding protein [Halovenus marina]|uniref:MinD/ParA family ATP-binding protein n=1 Tax=Halovenus marina TaxID=3396621 RepID=UPI003F56E418
MAGYVCTIAGGKGGVGKTTTAVNLGVALEDRGYDTVVIDADLGMANLGEMLELDHDRSLHEILAGDSTVSEALTDAQGGLTTVPGEQSLEAFAEADPAKLRKVTKTLKNAYDIVLIDTGAGLSHETTVPLGLADGIVLVTTPDDVAINDTKKTADLAERVDGTVLGAIISRVTADTDVAAVTERLDMPMLGIVPEDVDATRDEPLVLNSPESNATAAYTQLAESLERIFFEGATGVDLDPVFEEEWFLNEDEDSEDEEDDGGVFGGLFG